MGVNLSLFCILLVRRTYNTVPFIHSSFIQHSTVFLQSGYTIYFAVRLVRLLFEGGVYFCGIYTSKYKKKANKRTTTTKRLEWAWLWVVWRLQQSFEFFDKLLLCCYNALSSPCDFTCTLSPVLQKVLCVVAQYKRWCWSLHWERRWEGVGGQQNYTRGLLASSHVSVFKKIMVWSRYT